MEARCAEMRQRLELLEDRLQVLSHQLEVEWGWPNRRWVGKSPYAFFRIPWEKVEGFTFKRER